MQEKFDVNISFGSTCDTAEKRTVPFDNKNCLTYKVENSGERLDKFLAMQSGRTRSQLKHAKVFLNGEVVKSGARLRAGDIVMVEVEREVKLCEPENIPIDVVFEDDFLMIINKPRGLVVHPGAGNKCGTLLNGLLGRISNVRLGVNSCGLSPDNPVHVVNLDRGGIVHRLDKNTAGLLLVAKTVDAQAKLSKMFEEHNVRRIYWGLVEGVMTGRGTISKNIIRDPNHRTIYKTSATGGRKAVTHFEVLHSFSKWTLVQFKLETGRTHQIRVHCKSVGHPIVADPEYNPNSSIKGLSGQMLESVEMSFLHPVTSEFLRFKINPSEEFRKTVDRLV